jgi:hypothetical protein
VSEEEASSCEAFKLIVVDPDAIFAMESRPHGGEGLRLPPHGSQEFLLLSWNGAQNLFDEMPKPKHGYLI